MTLCKIGASHYMHLKTHVLTFIQILMKDILHSNCKIGIMFIHVVISPKYSNGDYQFPLPPPPLHVRSFFWMQCCSVETMFNGCQLTVEHRKKCFLGSTELYKSALTYMYIKITPILEKYSNVIISFQCQTCLWFTRPRGHERLKSNSTVISCSNHRGY